VVPAAPVLFLYFYLLILRIVDDPRMPLAVASIIPIESSRLILSMVGRNTIRPEAEID
jgi:hypothetical protein